LRVFSVAYLLFISALHWQSAGTSLIPVGFEPDCPPFVWKVIGNKELVVYLSETLVVHKEQTIFSVYVELILFFELKYKFVDRVFMVLNLL
jgi:hypothetical protein